MPTHPTSQTEWDDGKRRVVILGGGFAGVSVARRLERLLPQQWDIFLLSKSNVITYNPLLPEVVGATLLPGHAVAPLRHILGRTRIRMVEVTNVDLEQRYVEYNQPSPDRIRFDHLVLACGLTARMDVVPGMADHGVPLKSLGDALYVRNQTIGQLEEATLCYDPQRNRCLTSFIVAGGGFSGVEAAGELQDLLNSAAPLFKRVAADSCHVHLVHSGPVLLPEVSPALGRYTQHLMEKRGIRVHLNSRVHSVAADHVLLNDGTELPAAMVVNTIGTTPHQFISRLPIANERGRIQVDEHLQVPGTDGIWALGDCAEVPNQATGAASPTTAQFAMRQATLLAHNLTQELKQAQKQPFAYQARGQLAAIGHRKAVAEVYGVKLSGLLAWFLWRAFYLFHIPTLSRKVRLFLEWNWAMLFPKDIAQLDFSRTHNGNPGTSASDSATS